MEGVQIEVQRRISETVLVLDDARKVACEGGYKELAHALGIAMLLIGQRGFDGQCPLCQRRFSGREGG